MEKLPIVIGVLGGSKVGKSTFINTRKWENFGGYVKDKYSRNKWSFVTEQNQEFDVYFKELNFQDIKNSPNELEDVKGAILMVDLTNQESLRQIYDFDHMIKQYKQKIPTYLVGNKFDKLKKVQDSHDTSTIAQTNQGSSNKSNSESLENNSGLPNSLDEVVNQQDEFGQTSYSSDTNYSANIFEEFKSGEVQRLVDRQISREQGYEFAKKQLWSQYVEISAIQGHNIQIPLQTLLREINSPENEECKQDQDNEELMEKPTSLKIKKQNSCFIF